MSTTGKKSKKNENFEPLEAQNFIAAKLNAFTVSKYQNAKLLEK